MENSRTWVLIADASKARIYSTYKARLFQQKNPKDLKLEGNYIHNESRKKNSELESDKHGEFGSGTFVEATEPKTYEAEQFAHQLLNQLDIGRKEGSYRDLILVAPPSFMGILNKCMSHEMHKLVSQTIEKDYTQHNERELVENLLTFL